VLLYRRRTPTGAAHANGGIGILDKHYTDDKQLAAIYRQGWQRGEPVLFFWPS
jgi:hypothetical protein